MANKSNVNNKYEKFRGFENWSQQANFTQIMLKKKEVCNIVDNSRPEPITVR